MPTGPQGQKRPRDTVQAAIMVGKLSTGELTEELHEPPAYTKAGGRARAKSLTKAQRSAIARKAALARWHKVDATTE